MGKRTLGLKWNNNYSVGVEEIDKQHKNLFTIINNTVEIISNLSKNSDKGEGERQLNEIITSLLEYKKIHFETEEKYFKEFNFEGAQDHIAKHQEFSNKLTKLKEEAGGDIIAFSFIIVDFLEDWLVDHLMTLDQEYKECFKRHGLK